MTVKSAVLWKSSAFQHDLQVTCLLFCVAIEFVFIPGLKYKWAYLNKGIFKLWVPKINQGHIIG